MTSETVDKQQPREQIIVYPPQVYQTKQLPIKAKEK